MNARPTLQRAWVGVGANLGDPQDQVRTAISALRPFGLTACSSLYRSAPVDAVGPDFINAVCALDTALAAPDLLAALHAIEASLGRTRPHRNAPRSIDLDLLLFGDEISTTDTLRLPHPRLHQRAFVLRPLLELSPELRVQGLGRLADWLPSVADQPLERLAAPAHRPPPTMPA